jgi:hypothetical protein
MTALHILLTLGAIVGAACALDPYAGPDRYLDGEREDM